MAMFIIWWTLGTLDFNAITLRAGAEFSVGSATPLLIALFIFLGCTGKSAQIPLYVWLPDAMAGPTPVSALIHAATMVTAGVFLVVRTAAIFTLAPVALEVVAVVGAVTAFFAATIGLRQYDIKKVLAYSTVSQLGYMFLGVGTGVFASGIFHLITHAFFKALLFLGAGSVIHAMHHALHKAGSHADPQDMRNMGELRRAMPWTFGLMAIATLAIAGVPPFAGFFSKDEILGAAFARGTEQPIYLICWALGLAAALMTAFYMARLLAMTFFGSFRGGEKSAKHLHEAPWIMTGLLAVLGVLTVAGGLINLPHFVGGHNWLEEVARTSDEGGDARDAATAGNSRLAGNDADTARDRGGACRTGRRICRDDAQRDPDAGGRTGRAGFVECPLPQVLRRRVLSEGVREPDDLAVATRPMAND